MSFLCLKPTKALLWVISSCRWDQKTLYFRLEVMNKWCTVTCKFAFRDHCMKGRNPVLKKRKKGKDIVRCDDPTMYRTGQCHAKSCVSVRISLSPQKHVIIVQTFWNIEGGKTFWQPVFSFSERSSLASLALSWASQTELPLILNTNPTTSTGIETPKP